MPWTSRGSSVRLTFCPIYFARNDMLFLLSSVRLGRLSAHLVRRVFHGVDDVLIAGAATEIAFQPVTDLLFGGIRILLEQSARGHDHSGRAIATLQTVAFPESFLHRVELAVLRQTLDGGDFGPIGLNGQNGAGLDGSTVHQRRAGAADGCLTADVGPG